MNFLDVCNDISSEYRIAQSIFPVDKLYTQNEKHNLAKRLKIFQNKFSNISSSIQSDKRMTRENKVHLLEMIFNIREEVKRQQQIKVKTSDNISDVKEMTFVRTQSHSYDELLKNFFDNHYKGESLKDLYKKVLNKDAKVIADMPKDDLLGILNQLLISVYDPQKWKIMSERKIRAFYKLHHDWHINLKTIVYIMNNFFGKEYNTTEIMKMSSAYFITFGTEKWLDVVGRG